jgi:phenylalanyl-tRNA synthetase beta chain
MRPTILPNPIGAARRNADGLTDGALFEIGPHYSDDTPEADDGRRRAAMAIPARHWRDPGRPVDAFLAKADALAALAAAERQATICK